MPGFELMLRAGRAAFSALVERWPDAQVISVVCGKGNNAGDGYVIAGLGKETGMCVHLCQVGSADELSGDAEKAKEWALARGVEIEPMPENLVGDVVVDALLGTGLQGGLRDPFAGAVRAINRAAAGVLAVDLPTGVNADTGCVADEAVDADLSVTFIGRKTGLYTGPGASCCGRLVYADLGVPSQIFRQVRGLPLLRLETLRDEGVGLPPRDANAYKQALGHVVVVGGDYSMGGAVAMAAESALRTGAGMVSVITRATHRTAILSRRPEVMVVDADDHGATAALFEKATVLVVGPGLGREDWGRSLLREAVQSGKPMVLDADGLQGFHDMGLRARGGIVVTPHNAEAATLLDCSVRDITTDRLACARALAGRVGGTAVLKGAGTVIATCSGNAEEEPWLLGVSGHGNPGMATAGMGDVLSGIIGGLSGQGLGLAESAILGVSLHGYAGDLASQQVGQRSLVATDILPHLMKGLRMLDGV